MSTEKYLMLAALLVALVLIVRTLRHWNDAPGSKISIEDLLVGDDGRISKAAAVMMGAFAVTTWVIVYVTLTGKLTDILFGAYLTAWVVPTTTALIVRGGVQKATIRADSPALPATTTTTTTETT